MRKIGELKLLTLGLICLLLIVLPFCKKTPSSPDIDDVLNNPPVISNFLLSSSSINIGESSNLSWSVGNATQITIDNGIGAVSAVGTTIVHPTETTTYTLIASNNDGQVSRSCTLEVRDWAIIEVDTTPYPIIFLWDPIFGGWYSSFAIVIGETNGVGAQITSVLVGTYLLGVQCDLYTSTGGRLEANSSLIIPAYLYYATCTLSEMWITVQGVDDNGFIINETYVTYFTWTAQSAQGGPFIRIGND